jgi:hypothetical protein
MTSALAESMGLTAAWVKLRTYWDGSDYSRTEESLDGETWEPYSSQYNVTTETYVGGPKDGKVEW